jgi:hemerythrin-like domain-containing protein
MLSVLSKVCDKLESGEEVAPDHIEQILGFLGDFADKCHHGKEEDLLFPAMEEAGIPREGGPIGVMLLEHVQGREHIQAMRSAASGYKGGEPGQSSHFVRHGRAYVSLLNQHIEKENNVLFRMADAHISERVQDELLKQFKRVDEEEIGTDKIEQLHRQLEELKGIY